jgi:hypothetical protein
MICLPVTSHSDICLFCFRNLLGGTEFFVLSRLLYPHPSPKHLVHKLLCSLLMILLSGTGGASLGYISFRSITETPDLQRMNSMDHD